MTSRLSFVPPVLMVAAFLFAAPPAQANHGYVATYASYDLCRVFEATYQSGDFDWQTWSFVLTDNCTLSVEGSCTGFGSIEVGFTGWCASGASFATCGTFDYHPYPHGVEHHDFVCLSWNGDYRLGSVDVVG